MGKKKPTKVLTPTNSSKDSPSTPKPSPSLDDLKEDFITYFYPFRSFKSLKHLCKLVSKKIKEAEQAGYENIVKQWNSYKVKLMKIVQGKWDKKLEEAKEEVEEWKEELKNAKTAKKRRKKKKGLKKAFKKYQKIEEKLDEAREKAEEGLKEVKVWYFNQLCDSYPVCDNHIPKTSKPFLNFSTESQKMDLSNMKIHPFSVLTVILALFISLFVLMKWYKKKTFKKIPENIEAIIKEWEQNRGKNNSQISGSKMDQQVRKRS